MDASLFQCFKQQVKETPENLCLVDKDSTYTYQQALEKIELFASNLNSCGITKDSVVSLYSEKSNDSILLFISLSALGADVLTLDLAFPQQMLEFTLQDSNSRFVLTDRNCNFDGQTIIHFDKLKEDHDKNSSLTLNETNYHWLVYSSGSTGKPKGIKISSRAMMCSIKHRYKLVATLENDRVSCTIYFYWEAFRPLLTGASIHVILDSDLLQLDRYIEFLIKSNITETLWTPSFAEMIVKFGQTSILKSSNLKRVWLNGEVVSKELSKALLEKLPNIDFYNLYSISETFDVSAEKLSIKAINDDFASIGQPLGHIKLKIIDKNNNECGLNKEGELCIGGESLCNEYINRNDLNKSSFLYLVTQGKLERFFRTGDIAFRDKKNRLFVLGRHDSVVKLRGYNVSLLQIEEVLKKTLDIQQCVVKLATDSHQNQHIEVFLSAPNLNKFKKQFELNELNGLSSKLVSYLSNFLPHYAIPQRFYLTNELGINAYSSKLERKNLKEKCFASKIEQALAMIWQKVLSLDLNDLSGNSDFFALGGSSLQAIEFIHLFNKTFASSLTLDTLNTHSSYSSQLDYLKGKGECSNKGNEFLDIKKLSLNAPYSRSHVSFTEAQHVFVTGATGFLGANWLAHQLTHEAYKNKTYYCLVRTENDNKGLRRLKDSFCKFGLDPTLINKNVKLVAGNLELNQFGLSDIKWNDLCSKIEIVFHAAANVNLLYGFDKLRHSIVDGSLEVIKLSVTSKLKHLIYISSDAVYSNETESYGEEFISKEKARLLKSGYGQAKWVVEQLIQQAANDYALPFSIFRLGNLAPHLGLMKNNPNDANAKLLSSIYKLKKIPTSFTLEFTPIDRVIDFFDHYMSLNEKNLILTISLFNSINANELKRLLGNDEYRLISEQSFLDLLEQSGELISRQLFMKELFLARGYHLEKIWPSQLAFGNLILSTKEMKQTLRNYNDDQYYIKEELKDECVE